MCCDGQIVVGFPRKCRPIRILSQLFNTRRNFLHAPRLQEGMHLSCIVMFLHSFKNVGWKCSPAVFWNKVVTRLFEVLIEACQ